jgi:hypothetical protein
MTGSASEPGTHNHHRACGLAAFAENKEGAIDSLDMREWPKGQARREYGLRACAKRRIPE